MTIYTFYDIVFLRKDFDVTLNGAPRGQNEPLVSAYVDYDNLVLQARHAGVSVSFAKLRRHLRTLGTICEAIVFVPPHVGDNVEVITTLTQAGFEIVLCPFQHKDKDAVDAYIKAHLQRKVLYSLVQRFVIVSEDNDFRHDPNLITFAEDAGREIVFTGAAELRELIEGHDAIELPDIPDFHKRCHQSMEALLAGTASDLTVPEDRVAARFMSSVFNAAVGRLGREDRPHFRQLTIDVWNEISQEWGQEMKEENLRTGLHVMIEMNLIAVVTLPKARCYELNGEHPNIKSARHAQGFQRAATS